MNSLSFYLYLGSAIAEVVAAWFAFKTVRVQSRATSQPRSKPAAAPLAFNTHPQALRELEEALTPVQQQEHLKTSYNEMIDYVNREIDDRIDEATRLINIMGAPTRKSLWTTLGLVLLAAALGIAGNLTGAAGIKSL